MNREQRELLLTGIRLYLNYQWTMVAPSPERNTLIRVLQALKGKLLDLLEQPRASPQPLLLLEEERAIARGMLDELLQNASSLPELNSTAQRAALQALKMQIEWNGSI